MIADVFNDVATQLQYVGDSYLGGERVRESEAPNRYVWVPVHERLDGPQAHGGNPRSLADRIVTIEVHMWGPDLAGTERLLQAFITALRKTVNGRNFTTGQLRWISGEFTHDGMVLVLPVDLRLPLPSANIPTTGPQPQPVTDETKQTRTITGVDDSDFGIQH